MKKRFLAGAILALFVFVGSKMLVAQDNAPVDKDKAPIHKEMKLTDEQKAKVEELKTSHRLATVDLRADLEKIGIMFKEEMAKPEPNKQTLEGLVKKMSVAREKLQMSRIDHMLAMRKILGPKWHGEGACAMGGEPGMMNRGGERAMLGRGRMPRAERSGAKACPSMSRMGGGQGDCCEKGAMMSGCKGSGSCKGSCSSASARGNWRNKMFRPDGRKSGKSCSGDCKSMGEMRGGCRMHMKGASPDGGCRIEIEKKVIEKR